MRYLSVCSGIEAATVAWHPLGWRPWAFAEVDKFPSAVLARHYPDVPNLGDMTRFKEWPDAALDLLVGGTPCQSFSVAGLRKGLADPRGNLMLTYLAIAERYRPDWLVWENVPGVLSSGGGRDFGSFLGALVELGYGFAYRVLDAQYFGLAQRRQRVFVVGCARGWQRAAAVLFERASLSGHPAPRREVGKAAPTIPSRRSAGGGLGTDFDCDGGLIARCISTGEGNRQDFESTALVAHSLRADGFVASEDGTGRGTPLVPVAIQAGAVRENPESGPDGIGVRTDGCAYTLEARAEVQAVAFAQNQCGEVRTSDVFNTINTNSHASGRNTPLVAFDTTQVTSKANRSNPKQGDPCHPLAAGAHAPAVAFQTRGSNAYSGDVFGTVGENAGSASGCAPMAQHGMQVRRLTPGECESLQGFPRGYTAIPYRGKPAADGPRYKALGNSMAVPVMAWIGRRIAAVDAISSARSVA